MRNLIDRDSVTRFKKRYRKLSSIEGYWGGDPNRLRTNLQARGVFQFGILRMQTRNSTGSQISKPQTLNDLAARWGGFFVQHCFSVGDNWFAKVHLNRRFWLRIEKDSLKIRP